MALGDAGDIDRRLLEIPGALRRGHDNRAGGVGLEATIVEAEWIGDPSRGEIVVEGKRTAMHHGLFVELGVLALGDGDRAHRLKRGAVTSAYGGSRAMRTIGTGTVAP